MSTVTITQAPRVEALGGYRHEAFLYSGRAEFVSGIMSFIREAISVGDPVLVVLNREKLDLLRQELGADAGNVSFADMARVGGNPARIIAVWQAFVAAHAGARQLWGIGEPVHPRRSPTELAECQLHEALLNVAFDAATPFWLLCPYDLEALADDVIDEARRTHPFVARGRQRQAGGAFRPIDLADPFDRPVPPRPADAAAMSFQAAGCAGCGRSSPRRPRTPGSMPNPPPRWRWRSPRSPPTASGTGAGRASFAPGSRTARWSARYPTGVTSRRRWSAGCSRSSMARAGGLWVANQLCDLVQIFSSPSGTTVRLYQDI